MKGFTIVHGESTNRLEELEKENANLRKNLEDKRRREEEKRREDEMA